MRDVPPGRSDTSLWLIAGLLAGSLIAFTVFASLAQVASRGPGERVMARTIAILAEIDTSIDHIQASLAESALQTDQDPIPVPNFPIPVEVPRAMAVSGDAEQLRDEILAQSASLMYEQGVSAWDDADPEAEQSIATNSTAGGMRAALTTVGSTQRLVFTVLAALMFVVSVGLAFALTVQMRALERLVALGAVALAAGVPAIAVVAIARLLAGAGGDDPFSDGLSGILRDGLGVGLRNSLVLVLLGIALLALGAGGSLIEARAERGSESRLRSGA